MNANTNSESPLEPPGSGVEATLADLDADPIDWEARYLSGDTPWDQGYAAPALTEFLLRNSVHGEILVPGSGLGHDVRAIAKQGGSVVGLDCSTTAVDLASSLSPAGTETYLVGDLFRLPQSWNGRFDWVVEHTCFCAIPPAARGHYVRAISNLLKPGGRFFAIFYLNPATPEDLSLGPPHGVSQDELSRLFDPYLELLEEWNPISAFEGREGRELCQLRKKVI